MELWLKYLLKYSGEIFQDIFYLYFYSCRALGLRTEELFSTRRDKMAAGAGLADIDPMAIDQLVSYSTQSGNKRTNLSLTSVKASLNYSLLYTLHCYSFEYMILSSWPSPKISLTNSLVPFLVYFIFNPGGLWQHWWTVGSHLSSEGDGYLPSSLPRSLWQFQDSASQVSQRMWNVTELIQILKH